MAVSAADYSVLVRNTHIEDRYPGGLPAYRDNCPNQTFTTDGQMSRVGFMIYEDAAAFLAKVVELDLGTAADGDMEIALTSPFAVLQGDGGWLELGDIQGRRVARVVGDDKSSLVIRPDEWDDPPTQPLTAAELVNDYAYMGRQDSVDAYRHKTTGKLIYIGRTRPDAPAPHLQGDARRGGWLRHLLRRD